MEHFRISRLLSDSPVSKFKIKKWIKVNDLSTGNIRFKTSMFRSDLCYYSDAYFVVVNTVEGENNPKKGKKKLSFESNDPFSLCISKINNTFIDNA